MTDRLRVDVPPPPRARLPSAVEIIRRARGPWLIAGKGPTCRAVPAALAGCRTLTLNHACLVVSPTVAHFIDLEPVGDCAAGLRPLFDVEDPPWLVLPWHPHRKMAAGRETLAELAADKKAGGGLLARALAAGRLASYNSTTSGKLLRDPGLPVVRVRLFSAVAAFNLLASAGVRGTVWTMGVDGGTAYAPQFDAKDRLANGRQSFDDQWAEIAETCRLVGIRRQPV